MERDKNIVKAKKPKYWRFLQDILFFVRDDEYYTTRMIKDIKRLHYLIKRDTPWLASSTSGVGLPFHEQATKYYEYKNMVVQRKLQFAIIFLTITLLIMTGFQIYLTFFKH